MHFRLQSPPFDGCCWFQLRVSDRFALICASFVFVIALCGLLRGSDHLFDQFLTTYIYFYIVLVYVGFIVGKLTTFSFIRSSAPSV
jgi:F0F1-type ATP synthase assembly protein I